MARFIAEVVVVFTLVILTNKAVKGQVVTSCTEVLPEEKCKELAATASDLHIATTNVVSGLRDALNQKAEPETSVYTKVKQYLDSIFMCRIFLSAKMCSNIQEFAAKKNVPFHETEIHLHANIAMGVSEKKFIYASVVQFINTYHNTKDVKDGQVKSCRDLLDESQCTKLEVVIKTDGLTTSSIMRGINEATLSGDKDKQVLYDKVLKYLEATFLCQAMLSKKMCVQLQRLAADRGVTFDKVQTALQANMASGVKEHKALYTKLTSYIGSSRDAGVQKNLRMDINEASLESCRRVLTNELCDRINDVAARQNFPLHHVVSYLKNGGSKHDELSHKLLTKQTFHDDKKKRNANAANEKEECRKVLSNGLCNELEKLAKSVDLPSEEIIRGLKDGTLQKKTGHHEIYKTVVEYLDAVMLCEMVLNNKKCAKIHDLAYENKIPFRDVDKALQKYYGEGMLEGKELYDTLIQYIQTRVEARGDETDNAKALQLHDSSGEHLASNCEDILNVDLCERLMAEAMKIKLTGADVTKGLIDAEIQGVHAKAGIFKEVIEYLEAVKDCEKVLSAKMCKDLKHYAVVYKVPFHEVDHLLNKYMAHGLKDKKVMYDKLMKYLNTADDELNQIDKELSDRKRKVCTDYLDAASCSILSQTDVINGHKDAVIQGIKAGIETNVKEYLESIIECISILDKMSCEAIKTGATKWKIPFHEIDNILKRNKDKLEKSKIYDKVMAYILTADDEMNDIAEMMNNNVVLKDEEELHCYDVLSKENCIKLEDAATNYNLGHKYVMSGIRDASAQGATAAKDIFQKTKDYLGYVVMCENTLSKNMCNSIRISARKEQVPFKEIDKLIQKHLSKGLIKKDSLFKRLKNYISSADDEILSKKRKRRSTELKDEEELHCYDVLSKENCIKLEEAATNLGHEYVMSGIQDASAQGATDAEEIFQKTKDYLGYVIMCEKTLSKDMCNTIRMSARKEQVPFKEIDKLIQKHLSKGPVEKAVLFKRIQSYISSADDEILSKKRKIRSTELKDEEELHCYDVLSKENCIKLEEAATNLGHEYVMSGIQDASAQGATGAEEIFQKTKNYLGYVIMCEKTLSKDMCNTIRMSARKEQVPFKEIDKLIQKHLSKGPVEKAVLFKRIQSYISSADDEILLKKRKRRDVTVVLKDEEELHCYDVLSKENCIQLEEAASNYNLGHEYVMSGIQDASAQGATGPEELFQKTKEYLGYVIMCENTLSKNMCNTIRIAARKEQVPFKEINKLIQKHLSKGPIDKEILFRRLKSYVSSADDEIVLTKRMRRSVVLKDGPKKCTEVLPKKLCQKLSTIAKNDKYDENDVVAGIRDALIQGVKKETDIYKKANEYLSSLTECSKLLNHEYCGAIKHNAVEWKVPFHEADLVLRRFSKRTPDKYKLYQKVMHYVLTADDEPTNGANIPDEEFCMQYLSEEQCEDVETIADDNMISWIEFKTTLLELVREGVTDKNELYTKLKEYVSIPPDFGEVPPPEVPEVPEGPPPDIGETTSVIARLRRNIGADDEESLTCKLLLSEKMCQDLKKFSKIVFVGTDQIKNGLKDALSQGATKQDDIFNKTKEYLEARSFCDFVLTSKECIDVSDLALENEVPLVEVRAYLHLQNEHGIKNDVKLTEMTKTFIKKSRKAHDARAYTDHTHNECMNRIHSIFNCLALKIYSFKNNLPPSAVDIALDQAIQYGESTPKQIYKKTVLFLKSKVYCLREMSDDLCKKVHVFVIKNKSSLKLLNSLILSNRHKRKPLELYNRILTYLKSKQSKAKFLVIGE